MSGNAVAKIIVMKRSAFLFLAFLFSIVTATSRAGDKTGSARGVSYEFVFGKEPLVYSVHQKSETKNLISNPSASPSTPYANPSAQGVTTKTVSEIHFKFRLTAVGSAKDGIIAVHYEPFDYESETDSTGPSGRFVTSARGSAIKSTQNGIVIVDTEKGIGFSQAKGLKADIFPSLLSGTFDMNGAGNIVSIHGDLPFIDTWQEMQKTQIGIFGFRLAGHAVTNGETWEAVLPMSSAGPIKFDGAPLNLTNYFSLAEEAADENPAIATIKLSTVMRSHDLGGNIEERGQSTHADLSEFETRAFGMVHFDKKRHVFIDEDLSRSATMAMTVLVQGRALSSRTEIHTELQMDLLPSSANASEIQKPSSRKSL
jgi:hypothetical protein